MIRGVGLSLEVNENRILDAVDFRGTRGDVLGLIGPPEGGKTVLLKSLAGLLPLSSGSVSWDGEAIDFHNQDTASQWQRSIGFAFQNDALFDAMTVFENVAFPLRRRREEQDVVSRRVLERLEQVELAQSKDKYPSEISGGMRKRVGIARATVINPSIGFFDDPVAGLDPVTGAVILDLIVGLTRELSMATVIVSNDLPVLLPICERVMMMHRGRVLFDGRVSDLQSSQSAEVVQFVSGSDEGPL